jgi:hypothetical protein
MAPLCAKLGVVLLLLSGPAQAGATRGGFGSRGSEQVGAHPPAGGLTRYPAVVVREEVVEVQAAGPQGATPPGPGARNKSVRREQDVRRVLVSRRGQLQYCYASSFERLHRASGRVALTFSVRPSGEVKDIASNERATTLHDSALASCLISRIRTWRFPRVRGEVTRIRARFRFSPGHPR